MSNKPTLKPIMSAIGTTFVISLAASPLVNANENPFSINELSSGYMLAQIEEANRCGNICGGTTPTANKEGEMVKCGNSCGEVARCGSICGGVVEAGDRPVRSVEEDQKFKDVARCGSICAAVKPAEDS